MRQTGPAHGRPFWHRAMPFALVSIALLAALIITVNHIARSQESLVVLATRDKEVLLRTRASTVGEVLDEAGVLLGERDDCEPRPQSPVQDGMRISVVRAEPRFVEIGDSIITVLTPSGSTPDILGLAGILPGPDDIVTPGPDEDVPAGGVIRVVRVGFGEEYSEVPLPFQTEYRSDQSLEAGFTRVYRVGVNGITRVSYSVRFEDGVEVKRDEVRRATVKEPVDQIILRGTLTTVSRGGESIRFTKAFEMSATAYCPCTKCCGPFADGLTHTGLPAQRGVIAVDPRVIPLGSRVYVDGYGYAIAADTGSAIRGNKIDVCFDTHDEALAWGLRRLKVYVLE